MTYPAMKLILLSCILLMSTAVFADIRHLPLLPNQNVNLDGSWQFYPNTLSDDVTQQQPIIVSLPNSFVDLGGKTSMHGVFVQQFRIPDEAVGQLLALSVPFQYGAYELYIDDQLMLKTGIIGDQYHHQTMMAPKLRTFVPASSKFTIKIKFSSYAHIRGGLENSISLGYEDTIRGQFYRNVVMTAWVSGMLVMISMFMVLFAIYRIIQNYSAYKLLFLGLFILCFSLRSFFAVPFPYTLFTSISWLWGTRLEYLLTEFICLWFMTYLFLALPHLLNRYIYLGLSSVIIINICITLTQQPIIFQNFFFKSFTLSILLFLNMVYGVYRIFTEKIPFSKINTFAIAIICVTFIHDYLLGLNVIDSVEISFYSSCLYFVAVTLNLSRDYAIQSEHALRYNQQLLQLNQTLDQQVNERTQHIEQLNQQLNQQLKMDVLTGAFNRYALNQEIQQRFDRALTQKQPLTFFMIDVDYFKNYNDAYGHLKGDEVLKNIVQALQKILPENAILARYGGEEFAIVASGMLKTQTAEFAATCLQQIRDLQIQHHQRFDEKQVITISIGGAVMDATHMYEDIITLMKTADQQLYLAKIQRDCALVV